MEAYSLPISIVEKLFPFCFIVDEQGCFLFIGRSLKKLNPRLQPKKYANEHFAIGKPLGVDGFSNMSVLMDQLVVLQEVETKAQLMGQFISLNGNKAFIFVGGLVVLQASELTDLGLDFNDFAIQDQVFDFLLMNQTQKRVIQQAEEINLKLKEAHQMTIKASEFKSQFLANMSHELRTPMNGVLGMASVLKQATQLDPEQVEYVDHIIQSGEDMLALVNDILDLSKIESGYVEYQMSEIKLEALLEEVYSLLVIPSEKRRNVLIFENHVPKNVPFVTDERRLKQVVINLLGNAIKFTQDGEVRLILQHLPQDRMAFQVIDNGIGMSPQTISRLFLPFVQGDSSMTKSHGGTGLGLSISKKLVEALGGKIEVTSEFGRGSRFYFEIENKKTKRLKEKQ